MIFDAYKGRFLKDNVFLYVTKKIKGEAEKKDTLTLSEIKQLSITPNINQEIKDAFIFSCQTGLRWCDIKKLKVSDIDFEKQVININQSKTSKDLIVGLNNTAIEILKKRQNLTQLAFNLPSSNGANKNLKYWLKKAKIDKKITWHNARHSFGTNLIQNGVDIYTTSELLGHKSLKHTYRYVTNLPENLKNATQSINL
jgi:integrase